METMPTNYPMISARELKRITAATKRLRTKVHKRILAERTDKLARQLCADGFDFEFSWDDEEALVHLVEAILISVYPSGASEDKIAEALMLLVITGVLLHAVQLGQAKVSGHDGQLKFCSTLPNPDKVVITAALRQAAALTAASEVIL